MKTPPRFARPPVRSFHLSSALRQPAPPCVHMMHAKPHSAAAAPPNDASKPPLQKNLHLGNSLPTLFQMPFASGH